MLTSHDRVRIAATAIVCERTVSRVYAGGGTAYSRQRVANAAQALGLPPPPVPAPSTPPASGGQPPAPPGM